MSVGIHGIYRKMAPVECRDHPLKHPTRTLFFLIFCTFKLLTNVCIFVYISIRLHKDLNCIHGDVKVIG